MPQGLTLARQIEPELLDHLAADDPRAIHSRHDLRWINSVMAQPGIMARALLRHYGPAAPQTILDLGCGDGTLMLKVARRLSPRWRDVTVLLLDRQDIVSLQTRAAFEALQWHASPIAADVFENLEHSPATRPDIITVNLFLHHFAGAALARLLALASLRAGLFVACEPRRGAVALAAANLTWMIGCNHVTYHDAPASVRAGFRGRELSELWPARPPWRLREWGSTPLTHCFVAQQSQPHEL
jgi:SAM-dependent methyltransferase